MQYEDELSQISKLQPLVLFHTKVTDTLQQKQTRTERRAPLLNFAEFLLKAMQLCSGKKDSNTFFLALLSQVNVWYHVFNQVIKMHFKINVSVHVTCFITTDMLQKP